MKLLIYKSIYRLLGLGFIAGGLSTFLLMFGFFPEMAEKVYSHEVHIMQEFGCALAALGLLSFWYSFNLHIGKALNLVFITYFALIAVVHWIDFFKDNLTVISPLVNSIPTLGLGMMHAFFDFEQQPTNKLSG